MDEKDEFLDMGQEGASLWLLDKVYRSKRSWGGRGWCKHERVAAGHRHSWFLTEEAQDLRPAGVTTANAAAWPPQGLQPCNMLKHTETVTYKHTLLFRAAVANRAGGGFR